MLHISRGLYLRHNITQTNTEQIISFQHFQRKRDPISQNNGLPSLQRYSTITHTYYTVAVSIIQLQHRIVCSGSDE
jgi:hypothetical protein